MSNWPFPPSTNTVDTEANQRTRATTTRTNRGCADMTPQEQKIMEQALEALETYHGYMEPLLTVFGGPRVPAEKSTTYKVEKAIIAIKEALAQQSNEQVEPVAINELMNIKDLEAAACSDDAAYCLIAILERVGPDATVGDAITLIENISAHPPVPTAQPKEPEQEPVAYFNPQKGGFYWAKPTTICAPHTVNVVSMPLYTTPPQRTWVGLSLQEQAKIMASIPDIPFDGEWHALLLNTLEAKLKEKNT